MAVPSASTVLKKSATLGPGPAKLELKSMQSTAVAAKKEQAERDRKAVQTKEREQKRVGMVASKEDAEKDKKRKEREDPSQSQAQPHATSKVKAPTVKPKVVSAQTARDEDIVKKRKVDNVEVVIPKQTVKKTTVSRPAPPATNTGGTSAGSSTLAASTSRTVLASSSTLSKSMANGVLMQGVTKQAAVVVHNTSSSGPKMATNAGKVQLQGGSKLAGHQALLSQHQAAVSALAKSQGTTVVKTAASVSKTVATAITVGPEPFELPDIDSEYSDSDEEEQARKAALRPGWTQSPILRQQLATQSTFNPDHLFGAIPPLEMEGSSNSHGFPRQDC